jgi:hypothetical protein
LAVDSIRDTHFGSVKVTTQENSEHGRYYDYFRISNSTNKK